MQNSPYLPYIFRVLLNLICHFLQTMSTMTDEQLIEQISFHLINKIRRSLRVLLALARGTPIVTEEWFYSSLSTQDWVDPVPFLHAHHSGQQLARGLNKAQRIFLNTRFFVGHSSNPSQIFLETALSASGGSIADDLGSSDYLIFGTCLVCLLSFTHLFQFHDECVTLHC